MALSVRLRRAVLLSSSIFKDCSYSSIASSSSHLTLSKILCPAASCLENPILRLPLQTQSSSFHSSISRFVGRYDRDPGSKIPEDEILFEGCDYNHWLITMDFPKDPKPTPEEMVETYVQTLAKVVGSVEEAKKKMYACSTTTYQGFQAVMSEEMSEKFRGLPGVVFILPDSYIDPVNKEYGGDKYDNGVITPRPPPIQYGRQGRYGDGNRRRYDQPRYDRQRSPPAQSQNEYQQMNQGNPANNEYQGQGQGYGRSYTPQQNQGPPGQDGRGYGPPGQDTRSYGPPGQDGRSYGPPGQDGRSYSPPGQEGRSYGPPGDTPQQGYYSPMRQEGNAQMQLGYGRNYGPPQGYNPQNMQQGYGRNYGQPQNYGPPPQNNYGPPPGQEGNSFSRPPTDAQQGYTPMPRGNPQGQQQQGNPQVQPENKPYYGNQDADGASAPYGGEGRG